MIIQDYVEHTLGVIGTAVIGVFGWVWRIDHKSGNHETRLSIVESNQAKADEKTQRLNDEGVRRDTIQEQMTKELSAISRKMDTFGQVAADAQVTRAIVERLERRVDSQREEQHA
jgi:hypothetical protein